MTINITNSQRKHAKKIIAQQNTSEELAFNKVLCPKMLTEHLANVPCRQRVFTPELTLNTFLSQVISADQSCQSAVAGVLATLVKQGQCISANTAAYCKARTRLPEKVLASLTKETAKDMERQVPQTWLWRDRHIKLVDGSTVSMPDTPENQAVYPQPDTQKKGLDFP